MCLYEAVKYIAVGVCWLSKTEIDKVLCIEWAKTVAPHSAWHIVLISNDNFITWKIILFDEVNKSMNTFVYEFIVG